MKKTLLLSVGLALTFINGLQAQIGFENLPMPFYKNGSNGAGGFQHGNALFSNTYESTYGSWSGFAVSQGTDAQTSGYGNQYSCIAAEGYNQSVSYMVAYENVYASSKPYIKLSSPSAMQSIRINNSTFAYNSMRDGDVYAKKFGGTSGNDADFFLLSIKGYLQGSQVDSLGFYLADFRFSDNNQDYLINQWTLVDLSAFTSVDSLSFSMSSSDNGDYGMNTPAYFCIDELITNSQTIDFENYDFDYWNGEDLSGGYTESSAHFYNSFTPNAWGGFWSGFAYSQKTDITTAGYTNQFSAIVGEGADNSDIYAVGNGTPGLKFDVAVAQVSMQLTNATYAYLSMQNGDAFAKKFGGIDGTDPDWFLLQIHGFSNNIASGTIDFYLADFRFSDPAQDYMVNTWQNLDLSALGLVDSLSFTLSSSDNGSWGMNTPAYFCLDQITYSDRVENLVKNNYLFYPNPANRNVNINTSGYSHLQISDLSGKIIIEEECKTALQTVDINQLKPGVYVLTLRGGKETITQKLTVE